MKNAVEENDFSIVVFAKNEKENIPLVLDQLLQHYRSDKIIFVLDGEVAPTVDILSEKRVGFIQGPNKGKGAAIRMAIDYIPSKFLVFMDADGSHASSEIGSLLKPLFNDKADMVIGSRFLGSSEELHDSLDNRIRFIGNILGNFIINSFWNRTGHKVSDAQNGFRAIRREIFQTLSLKENGFAIEQEMVIKCLKRGYRIVEVPSQEKRRIYGQSHISNTHLFNYIENIIKNIF